MPAMSRTNSPFNVEIGTLAYDFGMTFHSGAHSAVQNHASHTCDQTTQPLIRLEGPQLFPVFSLKSAMWSKLNQSLK